ncbi:MAG: FecR domain-containing protein [Gemmatimonadetes bacterium]|nr:FecR domain-containing protein [Gemmatimonadota bacterium]
MTENPSGVDSPFGPDLWDVLARYVSNESPAEEAAAVRRWLAENPHRSQLVATLDQSIRGLAAAPPGGLDVEAAFRRVWSRRDQPQVRRLPVGRRWLEMGNRWSTRGLRAAAVVALGVLGATVWWRLMRVDSERPVLAGAPQVYTTGVGQTDSMRLPDGSRVVLGPASRLTLAAGYGSAGRDVEIVGEVLFDVLHDPARPFTVRAGAATVQDLGTTFAVRNDGGGVYVVVTVGSVLLRSAADERGVVLEAGDRGRAVPDVSPTVERGAATADDLAWTRGRLVFSNAPLSVVRADLRRWYGIELEIADSSLASRHLTASFAGEPVSRVLDIIGLALGATVERRGDSAVMRAR